jgi:hypothetical protein
MVQRSVVPPTLSAAYPDPDVTEAPDLVTRTSLGMSKPHCEVKSSGVPQA